MLAGKDRLSPIEPYPQISADEALRTLPGPIIWRILEAFNPSPSAARSRILQRPRRIICSIHVIAP